MLVARSFKLANLLLHIVISVLSLSVFDRLFGGNCPKASLLASLLFAVHPIHCEAVSITQPISILTNQIIVICSLGGWHCWSSGLAVRLVFLFGISQLLQIRRQLN